MNRPGVSKDVSDKPEVWEVSRFFSDGERL